MESLSDQGHNYSRKSAKTSHQVHTLKLCQQLQNMFTLFGHPTFNIHIRSLRYYVFLYNSHLLNSTYTTTYHSVLPTPGYHLQIQDSRFHILGSLLK